MPWSGVCTDEGECGGAVSALMRVNAVERCLH